MKLLPWQQQNWAQLHHYIIQQRIPQALLITGKKGYGKQQLARQFAHSLLCGHLDNDGLACGNCTSCLLFAAGTHPDFIAIQPEETGKPITVDQIRTLITRISLKPQFEKSRIVLVNPADAMILSFTVRNDLLDNWQQQLPDNAPNHFALNIFPQQQAGFAEELAQQHISGSQFYPVVRGRLVEINNIPVQKRVSKDSQGDAATHRELSLT